MVTMDSAILTCALSAYGEDNAALITRNPGFRLSWIEF